MVVLCTSYCHLVILHVLRYEYYFDIADSCQALVDAPDMVRSQMNFKRLSLTDIKIDIKRVPKKKELLAAMEAAGRLSNL